MAETTWNIPIPDTDKQIYGLFREVPDAPIVVFVHCLTAGKNVTEYYLGARVFEQAGYATFRFDLYGWEEHARRFLECTVDTHGEDLDLVVAALKERFPERPVIAIGHSMGGLSIMSSKERRYDAVALWEPTHSACWGDNRNLEDEWTVWEPSLNLFRFVGGVDELASKEYVASYRLRDCDALAVDFTAPMLTVIAGEVGGVSRAGKLRYSERTQGPSDVIIIDGADHGFYAGESLTALYDETLAWLNEQNFANPLT